MRLALSMLALMACGDGAFDAGFRGERIGVISGAAFVRDLGVAFPNNVRWRVNGSIVWTAPDGESLTDDHVLVTLTPERRFEVALYLEPPERFARAGTVLGQIEFWADLDVDGRRDADDPIIGRPDSLVGWSDAGLRALRPDAACDHRAHADADRRGRDRDARARRRAAGLLRPGVHAVRFVWCAMIIGACGDGARDASFRGERLGRIDGLVLADAVFGGVFEGDNAARGRIRGGIMWSVPGESWLDERGVLALRAEGTFTLDVYAPPPDAFMRAATAGRVALGQIVIYADEAGDGARDAADEWIGRTEMLVAWSPEGASGGLVIGEVPAGLSRVRPSAPCEVTPLEVHAVRGDDPLELEARRGLAPSALFADAGCVDALAEVPAACASLPATRWWCRYGPATAAMCAPCEYLLFPQGASSEQCDAWLARCVARPDAKEPRCWSEWRFCTAGEPTATRSCDLACACDGLASYCELSDPRCDTDLDDCEWTISE